MIFKLPKLMDGRRDGQTDRAKFNKRSTELLTSLKLLLLAFVFMGELPYQHIFEQKYLKTYFTMSQ
jgi:hypothetical protein